MEQHQIFIFITQTRRELFVRPSNLRTEQLEDGACYLPYHTTSAFWLFAEQTRGEIENRFEMGHELGMRG
jgi:hypothetical protein